MRKQYSERDPIMQDRLGNYYCRHVSAMTAERLHAKSDIAAELAHRDIEIDRLTKLLDERVELDRASRPVTSESSALTSESRPAGEAVAIVIENRIGVELAWTKPPSAGRPPVGTKLYTAPPAVSDDVRELVLAARYVRKYGCSEVGAKLDHVLAKFAHVQGEAVSA